jgi:hypothetical protein
MKKLICGKTEIFFDTYDPSRVISGDGTITTAPETWYCVLDKGGPSGIPPGLLFRSPARGSAQLTLMSGDRVMPIDLAAAPCPAARVIELSGGFQDDAETEDMLSQYFSIAGDGGFGAYSLIPALEDILFLMIPLGGAEAGQTELWLLMPAAGFPSKQGEFVKPVIYQTDRYDDIGGSNGGI